MATLKYLFTIECKELKRHSVISKIVNIKYTSTSNWIIQNEKGTRKDEARKDINREQMEFVENKCNYTNNYINY